MLENVELTPALIDRPLLLGICVPGCLGKSDVGGDRLERGEAEPLGGGNAELIRSRTFMFADVYIV